VSDDRSVDEMANKVLMRLRDGPHDEESVDEWQVGMARERAEERAEDLGEHLDEPSEHPTHG
jgi:hypothetical protein